MLRGQERKAALDPSRDTRVLISQFYVLFLAVPLCLPPQPSGKAGHLSSAVVDSKLEVNARMTFARL
jgi:hypothetical protein